jgi:hypothetical protein
MSGKIFGDADLSISVMRNPRREREDGSIFEFDGVVYQLACQTCETPIQVGLSWKEVRVLLDGGVLPGVQRISDGWQISAQCSNNNEGCTMVNSFKVLDEELEKEADLEVKRRQRVMRAQQAQHGGNVLQRVPQRRR